MNINKKVLNLNFMNIRKLNLYLLGQVIKYFSLILFIFLSIAWLLQITRLFSLTNFMQIEVLEVLLLSIYLIPNLVTVILPFILIFSLLLCFIKLYKDNELISIITLGLGLKPFKIALIYFSSGLIIIFILLNYYVAPKIYEKYKIEEFDLRNKIDLNNLAFSNFLNLNKTTILDFKKNNNEYNEIFISFNDEKENIIYAEKGNILVDNDQYKFQLINGFKVSIDEKKQIEKLEFLNYVLKVDIKNINNGQIFDKNTFTIFDDLESSNYLNVSFKIFDVILIFLVIFLFYHNNIKRINFSTKNNIFFTSLCISILILNQILKNSEIIFINYIIIIFLVIFFSLLISYLKGRYEQN